MKTYDEKTWEEIKEPDLSKGYVYRSRRQTGTKRMTLEGTEKLYPSNGLQYDAPVYEDCQLYHAYTKDELAAMQPPEEPSGDTEARLAALEDELAAAKILLGVE